MKRLFLAVGLVALTLTGCGGSSTPAATVNGVAIDRGDFLDELRDLAALDASQGAGNGDSATTDRSAGLLTALIAGELRAQEIKRLGLAVTDADLADARTAVESQGIPPQIGKKFVDFVVRLTAEESVLDKRIQNTDQPWYTDADVQAYYDLTKDTKYTGYCTHHILVDSEDTARALLQELRTNPASFEQLAKDNSTDSSASNGGDLGCQQKGAFVKEYEDAALAAGKGDIIGPVKSDYGYHIIRIDGTYGLQPIEVVRKSITDKLVQPDGWLEWKSYMSKISVDARFGTWKTDLYQVVAPVDPTK